MHIVTVRKVTMITPSSLANGFTLVVSMDNISELIIHSVYFHGNTQHLTNCDSDSPCCNKVDFEE